MSQLHVVHYNSDKYSSFHEAKDKQDGLAVLAFFYEVRLAVTIFFTMFVFFMILFVYIYIYIYIFIIIVVQCCHLMGITESKLSSKKKKKNENEKWKLLYMWILLKRAGLHQMTQHCLKHIARVKIDICILWTKWVNWSDRCVVAYCLTFCSHKTVCRSQAPSAILWGRSLF